MLTEETEKELLKLDSILTPREVATFLTISIKTVKRELKDGRLDGYVLDGRWNIPRASLRKYLSRRSNW
jgi:excisionase family DNA binding protein